MGFRSRQQPRRCAALFSIIGAVLGWLFGPPVTASAQTAAQLLNAPEQLLQRIDQIRAPADTFVFKLKLTAYRGTQVSSVTSFTVHVKGSSKSLVKFTAPPKSKGRVVLMNGDNLWIYIPGSQRALRISPRQRLLGQVAYGDVARVVYSLDYRADRVAEDTVQGKRALRLELTAQSKGATHDRIHLWVDPDTLRPIKANFLALSGKLLKVGYYKGYRWAVGRHRPMILEVHDAIRKEQYSILEYSRMRLEDTPARFFQRTYLEHVR
ncbi:MAG: outer membrane lipoprotein-sorting protein [Candidatus Methylomirabilia bacterium]